MIKIGLTGCIGSGKSTSAFYFKKMGVPVIDADSLVSEFFLPNNEVYDKMIFYFGKRILCNRGFIDRNYLKSVIFNNKKEGKLAESLIHEYVRKSIKSKVEETYLSLKRKNSYCLVSIPLLPNLIKQYRLLDRICVVDAGIITRINRVRSRDKSSYEQIKLIIKKQYSREQYLKLADDIIINNGSFFENSCKSLQTQINELHKKYTEIFS